MLLIGSGYAQIFNGQNVNPGFNPDHLADDGRRSTVCSYIRSPAGRLRL